jgi:hypothetical protein
MDGELVALAGSAATTIVTLLATDAWGEVKEMTGGLWRRFRPELADDAEQELDRAHAEIATADETVALAITREWESRLLRLLAADAGAAAELSRVLAKLSQSRPAQQRAAVRQTAKASGHSTVIQVGGDATIGELPLSTDSRGERS